MERPSILHLLAWIAGTAVVLGLLRLHDPNFSPNQWSLGKLTLIFSTEAAYGAAFAALAVMMLRHAQGQASIMPPGQWYMLALAGGLALQEILQYVVGQLSAIRNETDGLVFAISASIIGAIPFVVAFIYGGGGLNWKFLFGAIITIKVLLLVALVGNISQDYSEFWSTSLWWLRGLQPFIILLAAATAIGIDVARGMRRGWIHNVGCALLVALPCLEIAGRFVRS